MKYKKELTFIYTKKPQAEMFEPIIKEAERRGYKTKLTKNVIEKCELGFYCGHRNIPRKSKFSFIMLHDIFQGYRQWPNLWYTEPWDKYDVGILPGKQWSDMWKKHSKFFYTRPRIGVYEVGWPKADILAELDIEKLKHKMSDEIGISFDKKTILYAPSYEVDGKQNDFVESMKQLDVNILIKQPHLDCDTPLKKFVNDNIIKMKNLHKDIPLVYQLDPSVNIVYAISVSDILVSDESSTIGEAIMMGKPAISVSDWSMTIPGKPPRYPRMNFDYVIKTEKDNLVKCVDEILKNYDGYFDKMAEYRKLNYRNIGNSSKIIMDIVDDVVSGKKISYEKLQSQRREHLTIKSWIKYKLLLLKSTIIHDYSQSNKYIAYAIDMYRKKKGST